jgi:probable F420-dependent oxidoreductase
MDVGAVGLWTFQLDLQPAARARELAAEIERQGWGALWVGEAVGREPLTHAGLLLDATKQMVVATGVANIWSRSPTATAAAQRLLADDSGGRFLLGLGVSHAPLVEGLLGHTYDRPLDRMAEFLDKLDDAFSTSPPPEKDPPRVLAALGPKMLSLAADRAWGAHTYMAPVEHTAFARETLGPGPMLLVEQAVVLSADEGEARDVARRYLQTYLGFPNYTRNLLRLGFGEEDLGDGGSDKLVDALVAWGNVEAIAARVAAHREAGADHVCLQVLDADATAVPTAQWQELAAALVTPRKPRRRRKAPVKKAAAPAKKAAKKA